MQKHLVLGLCLLTVGLNATSAMAATSGIDKTVAQINILNSCMASYMSQAETFATYQGGSCVGQVNFQTGQGEMCAAVVDPDKSSINEHCVITTVTLSTGTTILPAVTGQKFISTPYTDTLQPPTPYSSTSKSGNGIVSWTTEYFPSTSQDLRSMDILGVKGINMLSKAEGQPLINVT